MHIMGIRIEPPDDTNEGFLYLKLNGILKGIPWAEEPPNKIFKCKQNIVGDYIYLGPDWEVSIVWGAPYTSITVWQYYYHLIAYSFNQSARYQYYGENAIQNPNARWYSGSHIISYSSMSLQPGSFQAQAAQVGVGDFPKLFAEPIGGGSANRTVRFARRNDRTCIYIKQE